MKKCPYCAEEIQDQASKCRFCGEFLDQPSVEQSHIEQTTEEERKWAEVRRLQRIASGTPTRADNMRKAKGLMALGIIIAILFYAYTWEKKYGEAAATRAPSLTISFEELNALCGPASPLPSDSRNEIFKKYKGKRVAWQGALTYRNPGKGSELFITVTHQTSIRAAGVQVNFTEVNRSMISNLKRGQIITYGGRIVSYDENAQFFTLANGKVISVEQNLKSP